MTGRALVGRGFVELAAGLRPLVDRTMTQAYGKSWIVRYENHDARGRQRNHHLRDPRFLLQVITEEHRLFKSVLPYPGLSIASELREFGNTYAHDFEPTAFTPAGTRRALEATRRLLRLAEAGGGQLAVRRLMVEAGMIAPSLGDRLLDRPLTRKAGGWLATRFGWLVTRPARANLGAWLAGAAAGAVGAVMVLQFVALVLGWILTPLLGDS